MRLLVFSFLLVPSIAAAQVEGVSLAYKHDPPATPQSVRPGLTVGTDVVAVFPDVDKNFGLSLLAFDGQALPAPDANVPNSVVFAREHLYVADTGGVQVFRKSGENVQTLRQKGDLTYLTVTPDGGTIFAIRSHAPATITIYARDGKTGRLTQSQVFQTDDDGLALAKASRLPITIDPAAVRVPRFDGASGTFTDGKRLLVACAYSNSVALFVKTARGWQHIESLVENKMEPRNGLAMCQAVAMNSDGDVFVGGMNRLCRFRLAGEKLKSVRWWTDDSESGATPEVALEFVNDVRSLAFSKNGKYLFAASTDAEGVTVYKVGNSLEFVGVLKDSPGSKTFDVAVVDDKLFAKTSTCQLLIYDLDSRFNK